MLFIKKRALDWLHVWTASSSLDRKCDTTFNIKKRICISHKEYQLKTKDKLLLGPVHLGWVFNEIHGKPTVLFGEYSGYK